MNVFLIITSSLLLGAPNPVLPGVADVGVFRHAGVYYLMGVGTSGGVYTSDDLVHWSGPVHAFSMNNAWTSGPSAADTEIHACDTVLHNGLFHLYWSVNHGPLRQIGHAVADTPLGPYHEPVTDAPFDGRIDPQCFQDDDGRLYFYTVKFTLGNVIHGQPMDRSGRLTGRPKPLLTALPNTWETLDTPPTTVNEGPFVLKYRNRYYMIYNANHTGRRFGNYALGLAEADTPLGFNNPSKYDFPVLRSNRDPIHENVQIDATVPLVKNCGQPNLVRGPNGMEWWLVCFADMEHRAQHIDRVHFFGRELFIEGPTTGDTPGYHPPPALPSFPDLFEGEGNPGAHWQTEGLWQVQAGLLTASADAQSAVAKADVPSSRYYVLETTLRHHTGEGRFGVLAWDNGKGSRVLVGLDRKNNRAFRTLLQGGHHRERSSALPDDFNWAGPHTLRIEKNGDALTVYLGPVLLDSLSGHIPTDSPGQPDLFAENCSASFDNFVFTRGWDESADAMRNWETLSGHRKSGGTKGIVLRGDQAVFKGDALGLYEFSAQFLGGPGGVYPVYVDDANYLRVSVNPEFTQVTASGKCAGVPIAEQRFEVHPRLHRAHPASGNGNNLRAVKLADRVVLFAEGLELGAVPGTWPDSRIGLFSEEAPCTFTAATVYELPPAL